MVAEPIVCTPRRLPNDLAIHGARMAASVNPANTPAMLGLIALMGEVSGPPKPDFIAALTTKWWGSKGPHLSVAFLDNTPADLQARILGHMNIWGQYCNAVFVLSKTNPQVRITRGPTGYWSYVGTDILLIPANQPTMNLQDFTMNTPESEFHRVVRHETGHTLGFPHEHMRADIVARIDPVKAIAYFGLTQGWTPQQVQQQVLTPLSESQLITETRQYSSDTMSIMCYQLPGSIMKDGQAVLGGTDIDPRDQAFAGQLYPPLVAPKPPPAVDGVIVLTQDLKAGTYARVPA